MKITRKQLRKIIQEAMYNPRGRRDADLERLDDEDREMIRPMIDDPAYGDLGNEMLHSLGGYEPSPEFPDAPGYTEEIGQFDQKMRDVTENILTPDDKQLRKMIVDNLFDPQGDWRIPVDSLTDVNTQYRGGFFKMHFMLWSEIIPEAAYEKYSHPSGMPPEFEAQIEKVFNSMGGSYHQGDGDTLVPLPGIKMQDQLAFNQVILKVLNNDPQYV